MKKFKLLTIICTALAMLLGFGLSNDEPMPVFAEGGQSRIFATKSVEFHNINGEYIPIKVKDLTCSALELEIHYDTTYFEKVENIYSNQTFDQSQQEFFDSNCDTPGLIKATYLFKKNRTFEDDTLLYFHLYPRQLKQDVTSYLDIIVGNVINTSNEKINVLAEGSYLTIHQDRENSTINKYIYHNVNLNKFEIYKDQHLEYKLNNTYGNSYRSGEISIEYDRDLLAFENIQFSSSLQNSFNDVNSNVKGVIFISFISDKDIGSYTDLFVINFKCIKSFNVESQIKTIFKLIADKDNEKLKTENITSSFKVLETSTVVEKPRLYLNDVKAASFANFDVALYIDEKANLGAADLTLTFDANKLTYVKNTKYNINSIIIGVNERKSKEGIINISLLSTKGINDAFKLVSFTFITTEDINGTTDVKLTGKNIKNPLIQPLDLAFKGSNVELTTHIHGHGDWTITKNPVYIYDGEKKSTCPICGIEVVETIPRLLTDDQYQEVCVYAKSFIEANVCGTNDYTPANSTLFLKQEEAYKNLSLIAKEALSKTKANSMSENIIEQCLAKYDRIMQLHYKQNTDFPDFMDRVNNPEVQEHGSLVNNSEPYSYLAFNCIYIIVFVLIIFISSSVFIIMRNKKLHKNK